MQLPKTATRVTQHTEESVNQRIQRQTEASILHCMSHPKEIDRRLQELDEEWDIERALELNAGVLALSGMALSTVNRKWVILSAVVAGFLAQHAAQGWCPPVPIFRRLGFRTEREIDEERSALKVLRGDFNDMDREGNHTLERVEELLAATH